MLVVKKGGLRRQKTEEEWFHQTVLFVTVKMKICKKNKMK